MDRKTFFKTLAAGAAVPGCCFSQAPSGKCDTAQCGSDAAAVRKFLSDFLQKNETTLDRKVLIQLAEERGRACCRALAFRQKLIDDSAGNIDKLVELMGKIVGPDNCRRNGDTVTLIYPQGHCVCGWSPKRDRPMPEDFYCECSKANNQLIFSTVYGKPVQARIVESHRRGGKVCRFLIDLA